MPRFARLTPMLQYSDLRRTVEWYEAVLRFRCVATQGEEWCRLERDGVALMLMRNAHLGAPQATATQYIDVDDVMALWTAIKDRVVAEWGRARACPMACWNSPSRIPTATF